MSRLHIRVGQPEAREPATAALRHRLLALAGVGVSLWGLGLGVELPFHLGTLPSELGTLQGEFHLGLAEFLAPQVLQLSEPLALLAYHVIVVDGRGGRSVAVCAGVQLLFQFLNFAVSRRDGFIGAAEHIGNFEPLVLLHVVVFVEIVFQRGENALLLGFPIEPAGRTGKLGGPRSVPPCPWPLVFNRGILRFKATEFLDDNVPRRIQPLPLVGKEVEDAAAVARSDAVNRSAHASKSDDSGEIGSIGLASRRPIDPCPSTRPAKSKDAFRLTVGEKLAYLCIRHRQRAARRRLAYLMPSIKRRNRASSIRQSEPKIAVKSASRSLAGYFSNAGLAAVRLRYSTYLRGSVSARKKLNAQVSAYAAPGCAGTAHRTRSLPPEAPADDAGPRLRKISSVAPG